MLAVGLRDSLEAAGVDGAVLGSLRRDQGGLRQFLTALAEAHLHGVDVDFETVFAGTGAVRTDLPTYPFERRRYWPAVRENAATGTGDDPAADSVEARFWETVEQEDLRGLTEALALPADAPLSDLLPALSQWRQSGRERATADALRYAVTFSPLTPGAATLTGTWLPSSPPTRPGAPPPPTGSPTPSPRAAPAPYGGSSSPRHARPHRTRRPPRGRHRRRRPARRRVPARPRHPRPPRRAGRQPSAWPPPSPSSRPSATTASTPPCGAPPAVPSRSAPPTPRPSPPRP
ncbi:hypothetical protein SALBM217S_03662 [Streptomyces griseoloalbus]